MDNKINISDKEHRGLFKVPENYFEQLPREIQGKVRQNKSQMWAYVTSGVTLASLFLVVFFFPVKQVTDTNSIVITAQEAYDYLVQNDELLVEDYLWNGILTNDIAINTSSFYYTRNTEHINTDVLEGINIDYLDLEDYELED
jgi:hypothetical protein